MRHDLTHPLADELPVYPGDPPVSVAPAATVGADGYRVTSLSLSTHAGTHVDAPSHLLADGPSLDSYPVETFSMTARLVDVDVAPREAIGPDALPSASGRDGPEVGDLSGPEAHGRSGPEAHGRSGPEADEPAGAASDADAAADVVVFRTGWDDHWGSSRYRDHPYLAAETAAALADRGQHVALDAASPDPSPPADGDRPADEPDGHPAHRALFGAGRLVFENLRGLAELPARFRLDAYPLRVDADGAPVRAVAVR